MRAFNKISTIAAILFSMTAFQNCGKFKVIDPDRSALLSRSVLGADNLYSNMGAISAASTVPACLNPATETSYEYPGTPTPTPCPTCTPNPTPTPCPGCTPTPSPTPGITPTPTPGITPTPTPGITPTPTPTATPEATPTPVADTATLPIKRHCDGGEAYWWKYNGAGVLQGNSGVFLRITNASGVVLCELRDILEQLKAGQVTLPNTCFGGLPKAQFLDQLAYSDRTKPIKFQIFVLKGTTEWQINDPKKRKDNGVVMQQLDPSWIYMGNNVGGNFCDQNLSPLFIDFRSKNEYSSRSPLTSPLSGVFFDLLGDFAAPPFAAHQKVPISWFTSSKLMYLSLPNQFGRVDGINELFGDHTRGPDNRKADHGFAALAKYDGFVPAGESASRFDRKANGVIDSRDWIFSKLRLWSDRNFNGLSEPHELLTLDSQGVQSVELDFEDNYREMDKFKNEIRFKSIVHRRDGSMNLMFDAWFTLPKQ